MQSLQPLGHHEDVGQSQVASRDHPLDLERGQEQFEAVHALVEGLVEVAAVDARFRVLHCQVDGIAGPG